MVLLQTGAGYAKIVFMQTLFNGNLFFLLNLDFLLNNGYSWNSCDVNYYHSNVCYGCRYNKTASTFAHVFFIPCALSADVRCSRRSVPASGMPLSWRRTGGDIDRRLPSCHPLHPRAYPVTGGGGAPRPNTELPSRTRLSGTFSGLWSGSG